MSDLSLQWDSYIHKRTTSGGCGVGVLSKYDDCPICKWGGLVPEDQPEFKRCDNCGALQIEK